jgi:hypothetical protein
MNMVQSTLPSYNKEGLPVFSDPRVVENLYNSQNWFLSDTRCLAQNNGFQVDQLRQDFTEMSADFAVLRNAFQHSVDFHHVPLQDTILPPSARSPRTPCGCPVAFFTKDFSSSSPDYIFQARTSPHSVRSPITNRSVLIQSLTSDGPGSPPPLELITHSSNNSSVHSITNSIPILIPPPEDYQLARSNWSSDGDSELSEEASEDGNTDDSEEAGEELREGFSASGIRDDSI